MGVLLSRATCASEIVHDFWARTAKAVSRVISSPFGLRGDSCKRLGSEIVLSPYPLFTSLRVHSRAVTQNLFSILLYSVGILIMYQIDIDYTLYELFNCLSFSLSNDFKYDDECGLMVYAHGSIQRICILIAGSR